jgi:transposase
MANTPIRMIRVRKMLQMLSKGFSGRSICQELQMGRGTYSEYYNRVVKSGQSYEALLSMSDNDLSELVSPTTLQAAPSDRKLSLESRLSDYVSELKRTGVTRMLLWEEYRQKEPEGYSYAQFCELLSRYMASQKLSFHNIHLPGDVLQVDFAGDSLWLTNPTTGQKTACAVLVCTLPHSSYTYVEALNNSKQEQFYNALNKCLDYIGGVPQRLLSDNMKQYVVRADRYEPTFNECAEQWAVHYNIELSATRVKKPKDKANVERHVNIVYQQIYGRLRNEVFHTLKELNNRILELLDELNHKKMQHKGVSRYELFMANEQPRLNVLPATPFLFKYRKEVTINSTYHILIKEDNHFYSVPYQYFGKKVSVVYDNYTVEIYHGYTRIAIHQRTFASHGYSTLPEHLPEKHKAYQKSREYNAAFFRDRAQKIGPYTLVVINRILHSRVFIQQSYQSCSGVLGLTRKYTETRIEASCKRAATAPVVSYQTIKNILEKNLDLITDEKSDITYCPNHENLRGSNEYK